MSLRGQLVKVSDRCQIGVLYNSADCKVPAWVCVWWAPCQHQATHASWLILWHVRLRERYYTGIWDMTEPVFFKLSSVCNTAGYVKVWPDWVVLWNLTVSWQPVEERKQRRQECKIPIWKWNSQKAIQKWLRLVYIRGRGSSILLV